jgi:hypothetical protein
MILCGFRFLERSLFHHYKRCFLTFKMRRVVVAQCFIPVHSLSPLLWVQLYALRATVPDFEIGIEQQMRPQMTKTNYFVTIVIGHDILGRLVGSFRAILPEVVEVAQVEDLDLEPIILLQLRQPLPHLILLPLL